ncbi:MAG TPA: CHASE2 domain-containing protein, partial [Acidovorax sp.]
MQELFVLWFKRPWLARCAAVVLAALLATAALQGTAPGLQQLEEQASDRVWRLLASTQPERRVVLVDIDDASLAEIGPWPWSRQTMAELTQKLDAQGVGLKLFDVVFPDERVGNAEFARALAAHSDASPSVLAQVFALRNESQLRSGALGGALAGIGCQAPSVPAQGYVANTPGLHALAGHITPTLDADGAVRRMAALVCMDERSYPALALAGVAALGTSGPPLRIQPGKGPWAPAWTIELSSLPGRSVGLDAQGQIRVPYGVARSAMVSVSASDVLRGKVPPELLHGAWVVVGASAFGLADVVPTALGGAVSGAEVHLQLLAGLLDSAVPATPRAAPWLQAFYALLVMLGL